MDKTITERVDICSRCFGIGTFQRIASYDPLRLETVECDHSCGTVSVPCIPVPNATLAHWREANNE